jgi:hypothetical protein
MYDNWCDDKRLEVLFKLETEMKAFVMELIKRTSQKEADKMLRRAKKIILDLEL